MSGCAARVARSGRAFAPPGWWRLHQSEHGFTRLPKGGIAGVAAGAWTKQRSAKGLAGMHESPMGGRAGGAQGNLAETRRKLGGNSIESKVRVPVRPL